MNLFDVLGMEAESKLCTVRVEALFASLPPEAGEAVVSTRLRFHGEVSDRHGRRWQAIVSDARADLLRPVG